MTSAGRSIAVSLGAAVLALLMAACNGDGVSVQHNSISSTGSDGGDGSDGGFFGQRGADGAAGTDGGDDQPTARNQYQVSQPVSRLSLDGRAGSVTVLAGPGPISVVELLRYSDDKPATSHQVNGDALVLREEGCQHVRSVNGRCEVEWEIHAPPGTVLDLSTGAGSINITGFSAPVTARTNSGGIRARELTAGTVNAKSDAGGVRLSFARPPDEVTAISNAGGVRIEVPAGTSYAVQAESDTGDPHVDVARNSGSPHRITARTDAGSVRISNP